MQKVPLTNIRLFSLKVVSVSSRCHENLYHNSLCISCSFLFSQPGTETFNNHKVLLDNKGKIISWITPQREAYHQFLGQRWNFIKTGVPNSPGPAPRSNYPQYFFYCAYKLSNGLLEPDNWMNDVGEKVPNWVESARLYYAYSGDSSVMEIVQRLADYAIDHGTSPADFYMAQLSPIPPQMQVTPFSGGSFCKTIRTARDPG